MNRNKIKEFLKMLDKTDTKYYKELEIAIILFLRSDLDTFDSISKKQINEIFELTDNYSSLLDIDKEEIDYILEGEEDNE